MSSDGRIADMTGKGRSTQELIDDVSNLRGGPSGPTDGGMEARVAVLETKMDTLIDRVGTVEGDIRELNRSVSDLRVEVRDVSVRVAHLPSKGFIVSVVLLALGVFAALSTFSVEIRSLVFGG